MDMKQNIPEEEQNHTQHYEVLQSLGDNYTSDGKYTEAKRYYEKAANLAPDEAGPYVGLGVIALQNGMIDDAEVSFKVACRLDNKCSKAYCGLAMTAQQRNDYQSAFDMYLKALDLDKDNLTSLLGLFQVSCRTNNFGKVIYYLQVYLEMHPGDISVMFSLAALYMKDSQMEKSKELLDNILVFQPDNTDAANLLEEVEHMMAKTCNV